MERANGAEIHREERDQICLAEPNGALTIVSIEEKFEVVTNAPNLGAMWGKMAHPDPGGAQKGEMKETEYPDKILEGNIWVQHGVSFKGSP